MQPAENQNNALSTFERDPHDSEHPFSITSHALIRNQILTPETTMLIIYLLSHSKGWRINTAQLINHFKPVCGKDKVYRMLNEAIEKGYIRKEILKISGRFDGIKYFVSESPKFKKLVPHPENQDAGNRDAKNPDDKEEQEKEYQREEEKEDNSISSSSREAKPKQQPIEAKPKPAHPRPPSKPPEVQQTRIDDDDQRKFLFGQVKFINSKGNDVSVTRDDIYRHFVNNKLEYSEAVIEEAISRIPKTEPIGNIFRYLEIICENIVQKSRKPAKVESPKTSSWKDRPKYEGPARVGVDMPGLKPPKDKK